MQATKRRKRLATEKGESSSAAADDATASSAVATGTADATPMRSGSWGYFVAFDEPKRPILVDLSLLGEASCRSAKHTEYQAPDFEVSGLPAWRMNERRDLLCLFIKTLVTRQFVVPRGVCYHEALEMFNRECVAVPGGTVPWIADDASASSTACIQRPQPSLSTRGLGRPPPNGLADTMRRVVDALFVWPRLCDGLDAALDGADPGFCCTSSRVWVQFAPKPIAARNDKERPTTDDVYMASKAREPWLLRILCGIGMVHQRMGLSLAEKDEQSFTKLCVDGLELENTRWFVACLADAATRTRHGDVGKRLRCAARFAATLTAAVVEHGWILPRKQGSDTEIPAPVKYARAVVYLAMRLAREGPDCARLLCGACADDTRKSSTPERRAFEAALKARGGRVIRWGEDETPELAPLVFPPNFRSQTVERGPYVLLEFGEGCG